MKLPELPKVLNKREANWTTTVFRKWCENVYKKSAVFEIKYAKGNSLLFSAVKEHQMSNLLYVRHGTFVYKIPDMGEKTPFDILCLTELPSYIVVKFSRGVAIIPIDIFILESKRSKRKSLTWDRAKNLSTINFAKTL